MRQRIHYAWIVLAASFLVITVGSGVRVAFGAFVRSWETDFGATRGDISLVAMISFIIYGALQPVAGRLADRRSPGFVLGLSAGTVAAGLLLTRLVDQTWLLGLTYGLFTSIGFAGVSTVPATAAVTRWFQARRGLALAILSVAMSVGQMAMNSASIFLNSAVGWRQTLLIYAVALVAIVPLALWLIRSWPRDMGLAPYGAGSAPAAAPARPAGGRGLDRGSLGTVLRTPDFWWLALPFFVCGVTTSGLIDTHLIPWAEDVHLPQGATALTITLLAGFNSAGVLLSGYLSDRLPKRYILAFLYGMRALTLLYLMQVRSPGALVAFGIIFGLVDYSTVPPTYALGGQLFGDRNMGTVAGLVSLSHQVGSAVGSSLPGLLHDWTGNYNVAFVAAAALLAGASGVSLWLREGRPEGRPATRPA